MSSFLAFRSNTSSDLELYSSFFRDEKWLYNSGFQREDFRTDDQLKNFMECHHPQDLKGVIYRTDSNVDVAIAHFKHVGENDLELTGGIRPDLLNTGIGLFCIVFALDYAFKFRSFNAMRTVIYQGNNRSARANQKVGFKKTGKIIQYDVRLFDEYILTYDDFYNNDFNRCFLKRNGLLCEKI